MNNILKGKICPYCGKETEYIDSSFIYGKSYGMVYICKPCDAYCGVHKGSDVSLGRLANKELRECKKEAHLYFDVIWKNNHLSRKDAYKMLSEKLGIDVNLTHIGMFDVEQCKKVVQISKEYLSLI